MIKIKSLTPYKYRLFKKKNGEVVLQGAFPYKGSDANNRTTSGSMWEEIPIAVVEEE